MAKPKRKDLPRKGAEAVRFIEKNAKVIKKRQEGSHVMMQVRGPKGDGFVNVNVHGGKELSPGVWNQIRRELIRIGTLSVIIFAIVVFLSLLV